MYTQVRQSTVCGCSAAFFAVLTTFVYKGGRAEAFGMNLCMHAGGFMYTKTTVHTPSSGQQWYVSARKWTGHFTLEGKRGKMPS